MRATLLSVIALTLASLAFVLDVRAHNYQDAQSSGSLADIETKRLWTPPVPSFKKQPARAPKKASRPRLALVSTRANNITDVDEWFAKHQLALPVYEVADTPVGWLGSPVQQLPAYVPRSYKGHILTKAIRQPRRTMLLFYGNDFSEGRYLLALDAATGEFRYGVDFVNYARAPATLSRRDQEFTYQGINWAFEDADGTLYVAHGHSTYARTSKGMNAYLTALDPRAERVVWRSDPLVSNAANFEIIGDVIVSGYGFTNELDYLYLLDKRTGAVRQRLPVKSGPEYIVRKGARLYVRAYNSDFVLKLE